MSKDKKKVVLKKPLPKNNGLVASNVAANPLTGLIKNMEKEFGQGVIQYGEMPLPNVKFISSGIHQLDAAMGGGLACGRIIELYGLESSGKTTTCLEMVASCQRTYFEDKKRYGVCAYIDAEHAVDPVWAANIGVNMKELLFNQPDSGEQGFKIVNMLAKSGLVDLIVVDSVAALTPKEELEGEAGDTRIGAQARLMSQGLRILKGTLNKSDTVAIFINQIRNKIGVMFGSPETTPGGLALKFYASTRIEMRKGEQIFAGDKKEGNPIGLITRVKIPKNKIAPPWRNAEYRINFGTPNESGEIVYGVDKAESLFEAALGNNVIEKSGSWFNFRGEHLGLGKSKSVIAIRDKRTGFYDAIVKALAESCRSAVVDLRTADDEELNEELEEAVQDEPAEPGEPEGQEDSEDLGEPESVDGIASENTADTVEDLTQQVV